MFEKQEKGSGRKPDFASRDGIMVWKNTDKNGKEYLSVRIPLLNIACNCFALDQEQSQELDVQEEKMT